MVALAPQSMFAMQRAEDVPLMLARAPRTAGANPEFDAVARANYGRLRSYALRLYAGNETEANDLVHDALERALRRFASFTPGTQAFSWLCRIMHNAFIDRCRQRQSNATETMGDRDLPASDDDSEGDLPAWTSITREELHAAVDSLDEDFRVVFRMHAFESRSYQEIATALTLPLNTVGTRLARARKKLRDALSASVEGSTRGAR